MNRTDSTGRIAMSASGLGIGDGGESALGVGSGLSTDGGAGRPARLWRWGLAAGVAAGLIAWLAGEVVHGTFSPPESLLKNVNPALSPALASAQKLANIKNAILAFGLMGAVLGLILGGVGGLARGSPRAGSIAGLIGLLAGGAAGAGVSWVLVPIAERNSDLLSDNLGFALLFHAGTWSAVGAAGGLAFGQGIAGRGSIPRAVLGATLGALLGTVIYELVGALAAPLDETSRPLSLTASTRLLARLAVILPAALGAAWAVQSAPDRAARASKADPELA
jgi:hypothetical protein